MKRTSVSASKGSSVKLIVNTAELNAWWEGYVGDVCDVLTIVDDTHSQAFDVPSMEYKKAKAPQHPRIEFTLVPHGPPVALDPGPDGPTESEPVEQPPPRAVGQATEPSREQKLGRRLMRVTFKNLTAALKLPFGAHVVDGRIMDDDVQTGCITFVVECVCFEPMAQGDILPHVRPEFDAHDVFLAWNGVSGASKDAGNFRLDENEGAGVAREKLTDLQQAVMALHEVFRQQIDGAFRAPNNPVGDGVVATLAWCRHELDTLMRDHGINAAARADGACEVAHDSDEVRSCRMGKGYAP